MRGHPPKYRGWVSFNIQSGDERAPAKVQGMGKFYERVTAEVQGMGKF